MTTECRTCRLWPARPRRENACLGTLQRHRPCSRSQSVLAGVYHPRVSQLSRGHLRQLALTSTNCGPIPPCPSCYVDREIPQLAAHTRRVSRTGTHSSPPPCGWPRVRPGTCRARPSNRQDLPAACSRFCPTVTIGAGRTAASRATGLVLSYTSVGRFSWWWVNSQSNFLLGGPPSSPPPFLSRTPQLGLEPG